MPAVIFFACLALRSKFKFLEIPYTINRKSLLSQPLGYPVTAVNNAYHFTITYLLYLFIDQTHRNWFQAIT
jgi:hypothetical protein